jgi:hypothetical protein
MDTQCSQCTLSSSRGIRMLEDMDSILGLDEI